MLKLINMAINYIAEKLQKDCRKIAEKYIEGYQKRASARRGLRGRPNKCVLCPQNAYLANFIEIKLASFN